MSLPNTPPKQLKPDATTLRVWSIARAYWSHQDLPSKTRWDGLYSSSMGLVRVDAQKPWVSMMGELRPGYVTYTVIAHGYDITLREGRYRTPRGAGILAGRLLRLVVGMKRGKDTRQQFEDRIKYAWAQKYGGQVE